MFVRNSNIPKYSVVLILFIKRNCDVMKNTPQCRPKKKSNCNVIFVRYSKEPQKRFFLKQKY